MPNTVAEILAGEITFYEGSQFSTRTSASRLSTQPNRAARAGRAPDGPGTTWDLLSFDGRLILELLNVPFGAYAQIFVVNVLTGEVQFVTNPGHRCVAMYPPESIRILLERRLSFWEGDAPAPEVFYDGNCSAEDRVAQLAQIATAVAFKEKDPDEPAWPERFTVTLLPKQTITKILPPPRYPKKKGSR